MIKVTSLNMSFDKKDIFKDYNYNFEDGKIYVLWGSSGCGKTTLLRIISGLQKPNSGCILYNNEQIKKPNKKIFMMHQRYASFPWKNCIDNVLFPISIERNVTGTDIKHAQELLDFVGLKKCEKLFPYELSGGMQQRLSLVRTVIANPKVILMDEPLSALDPKTRAAMQDLILNVHKSSGNTVILVTHDEDEADKMADIKVNFKGGI